MRKLLPIAISLLLAQAVQGATYELRQGTDANIPVGPFLDPADGVTAETAITIRYNDGKIRKFGTNAWAAKMDSNDLIHRADGWFDCLLDESDTDTLGWMVLEWTDPNHAPVWAHCSVVTANVWDAKYSTDLLQVDVQQVDGNDVPVTLESVFSNVADSNDSSDAVQAGMVALGWDADLAAMLETWDPNGLYAMWLIPWQNDPNFTENTFGGQVIKGARWRR